jgi:hypothetical protein
VGLIGWHADVFGKGTVGARASNASPDKINATVVLPLLAIKTGPAVERGLDHYLLSNLPGGDLRTKRGNLSTELVPHNKAGRPGVRAIVKAIHVAATDAGALHLDEHLTGLRFGSSDLRQPNVSWTMEDGGEHRVFSSSR